MPKGKKAILVNDRTLNLRQGRQQTSRQYVYVDENMPQQQVEEMQKEYRETPWTHRKDWAAGEVIEEGVKSLGFLIGFTILWNLIANGIAGFILAEEWGTGGESWFILIFPVVGMILIIALLTIPAALARQFTYDLRKMMILAVIFGIIFTFGGLWISYVLDLASGATIVLLSGVALLISLGVKKIRNVSARKMIAAGSHHLAD